jgi:UDPglucose 6-dehydrogenase
MTDYKVVVDKSTVPRRHRRKGARDVRSTLAERGLDLRFAVVSNPDS